MKSFYDMLMILESSYRDAEQEAYDKISKALDAAGVPWDEDEMNVLYGKWIDMTLGVAPNRNERVQGVIYPKEFSQQDSYHPYGVGFEVNGREFDPTDIVEIHGVKAVKKYKDIIGDWVHEREYEDTLRSLPY